jgi:hypothetical protein
MENRQSSIPLGKMLPIEFTSAMINIEIIIMTEKKRNPFGVTKDNAICYKIEYINTLSLKKPHVAVVSFHISLFLPAFCSNAFGSNGGFLSIDSYQYKKISV